MSDKGKRLLTQKLKASNARLSRSLFYSLESQNIFVFSPVSPKLLWFSSEVRAYFLLFAIFPTFSGAHDNGYTSALTSLENEGFAHKLVLLRGYKDIAIELKNLQLPELTIDGVFMTHKLPANIFQRNRGHFQEFSPAMSAPASPKKSSSHNPPSNFGDEPRYLEPGVVSILLVNADTFVSFLLLQPLHKRSPIRSIAVVHVCT